MECPRTFCLENLFLSRSLARMSAILSASVRDLSADIMQSAFISQISAQSSALSLPPARNSDIISWSRIRDMRSPSESTHCYKG
jgi:hypothetical protein